MGTKSWVVAAVVLAVLVIGVGGGVVIAQENETGGSSPIQSLISRVAGILGLDEQQVQDAFDQAATEMRDEALDNKLTALVESGRITQEQADDYKQWYESRPDSLGPKLGGPGFGFHGHRHGRGWAGAGFGGFHKWGPASPTEEAPAAEETSL